MSLEQRILSRWKEWWIDKANQPIDRLLLQLIAIAVEEMELTLITLAAEIKQPRTAIASDTETTTIGE